RADAIPASHGRYHRERAALASTLKNYSFVSLLWVLPMYVASGFVRLLGYVLTRRFGDAMQVLAAWGWNIAHFPGTVRRRLRAQGNRAVRDREVRRFMAPPGDRMRRWGGLARQALFPSQSGGLEDEEGEVPRA